GDLRDFPTRGHLLADAEKFSIFLEGFEKIAKIAECHGESLARLASRSRDGPQTTPGAMGAAFHRWPWEAVSGIMDLARPFEPAMRSALVSLALIVAGAHIAAAEDPPTFPDLEFAGAEGGSVRLSQLKGNVVLLNVWATWCGPCRMELPVVQKIYDKYSDRNFVVLAINVDADRQRVEPFMKRYNISLPIYYAAPEDAGAMTTEGIPTTYLISADRHLLHKQVGFAPSVEDNWKTLIEKNLKARKPAR